MVRRSFTAVIEKNEVWTGEVETEPYEAAWASEARWFVRVTELKGEGAAVTVVPQVSPDGLFWNDEGRAPLVVLASGQHSFALRDFGQWLRLRASVKGPGASAKVMVYLSLKE